MIKLEKQWQQVCRAKEQLVPATRKWLRRKLHTKKGCRNFLRLKSGISGMNPQGNEWNFLSPQNTKITLQAKVLLRLPSTIWFTWKFLCHKRWKFRRQKQQWTRNGRSSTQSQRGNWTKLRAKQKEFILKAQRDRRKVHFATLMDICHLKNAELEHPSQKCKGRVVTRGDAVIDDAGAHTVFTEQGSSASQLTATSVMDVIASLNAPELLKLPKSECPDICRKSFLFVCLCISKHERIFKHVLSYVHIKFYIHLKTPRTILCKYL